MNIDIRKQYFIRPYNHLKKKIEQQIRYLVPDNKCANPSKSEAVMPEDRNGLLNPYKQQNQRAFQCRKVQSVPLFSLFWSRLSANLGFLLSSVLF